MKIVFDLITFIERLYKIDYESLISIGIESKGH